MTDQIRVDLEQATGKSIRSIEPIPTGHSGFTYFVSAADGEFVLRLPPPGARIAATADVMRQGRIMSALNQAGLPTPAVPFICSDPIVDGRPFILMERVGGDRIETMREFPTSSVDVLKSMQALPLEKTGIGDEDAVPLQVEMMRWAMLMQRAPEELTTRAGDLGGLLAAQAPVERPPTLVHGDYHPGNMLFEDGRVVAILDWEVAEIGQPLLDLGALSIVAGHHPGEWPAVPRSELFALYGVSEDEMRWYVAMSLYKYASIFGYNLMLHRRGKRPDPMYEGLTDTIVAMIDEGISLL